MKACSSLIIWYQIIQQKQHKDTNLNEAEGQECYIVGTEQRVEQHFFDSPVKVALELLHLCSDQLGCVRVRMWRAGVGGHVWGAGKLFSEVFTQQEEEVSRPKKRRLCQIGLLVVPLVIAFSCCRRRRLAFSSFLMETAEGDIHAEPGEQEAIEKKIKFLRRFCHERLKMKKEMETVTQKSRTWNIFIN